MAASVVYFVPPDHRRFIQERDPVLWLIVRVNFCLYVAAWLYNQIAAEILPSSKIYGEESWLIIPLERKDDDEYMESGRNSVKGDGSPSSNAGEDHRLLGLEDSHELEDSQVLEDPIVIFTAELHVLISRHTIRRATVLPACRCKHATCLVCGLVNLCRG